MEEDKELTAFAWQRRQRKKPTGICSEPTTQKRAHSPEGLPAQPNRSFPGLEEMVAAGVFCQDSPTSPAAATVRFKSCADYY